MKELNVHDLHDELAYYVNQDTTEVRLTAWEGEHNILVKMHCGAHGFYSAVVVVERIDSPLVVHTYDGYGRDKAQMTILAKFQVMFYWLMDVLFDIILEPGEHNPNREKGDLQLQSVSSYSRKWGGMQLVTL